MKNFIAIIIIILVLTVITMGFLPSINPEVNGECKLPGKNHDDNNPSKKKGDQLIRDGAGACKLAKKCDSMEIKVHVDDKKELHKKQFYLNAYPKVQEELDEYAEHGSGHDNPNIVCYEVQDSVKEK